MLHKTHTHVLEEAMEKNKVAVTLGPGNIVIQDMPLSEVTEGRSHTEKQTVRSMRY